MVRDFYFRRYLTDVEIADFANLIGMLIGNVDVRVWKRDTKDHLSVKTFCNALMDSTERVEGWSSFWDPSVLPRVLVAKWM